MNDRDQEVLLNKLSRKIDRLNSLEEGPTTGEVMGLYLSLFELHGFWPFSSVDENSNAIDLSAQGRTLSAVGPPNRTALATDLPAAVFNGTTSYYSRASEPGLAITTDLTLGGWFFWNAVPTTSVNFIGRTGVSGSFSYGLQTSGSVIQAYVSGNGTSVTAIADSQGAALPATWYFYAMRFTHSSELAIFVNSVKTVNTTAIPASIFAGTAAFQIGACSALTQFMNGRAALTFLSAGALSDGSLSRMYYYGRLLFDV